MKIKSFILTFTMAMLLGSGSVSADSTSVAPPAPSSMSSGSVPVPPVCNTSTQKLHWNGGAWQCLAVGHASSAASVTGTAKGSVISIYTYNATGGTNKNCPSGTSKMVLSSEYFGGTVIRQTGICIKN